MLGSDFSDALEATVADERVVASVRSVTREAFVAPRLRHRAGENRPLEIGCGQTISQPLLVARMCEMLELAPQDRVLDVGTGSGYHAAILTRLASHVWSIERHPQLSEQAAANLARAGIENVTLAVGDGARGLAAHAPFDAINVAAAAVGAVPVALVAQLAPGGRLIAPVVRDDGEQRLALVRRERGHGDDDLVRTEWREAVRFVPLVGADAG